VAVSILTEIWGSPGGWARALYRKTERAEAQYREVMTARLRPWVERNNKRPDPRLMVLAAGWKTPAFNRVESLVDYWPGRLRLTDYRLVATDEHAFPGWTAAGPVFQLARRDIAIGPGYKDADTGWSVLVSLHAVEQFYRRSPGVPTDLTALKSLLDLWVEAGKGGLAERNFTVPGPGGLWRCELAEIGAVDALIVRTFVPAKPSG
jgi:hypothetical protein